MPHPSDGFGFLDAESSRLHAANQARQWGQNFLMQVRNRVNQSPQPEAEPTLPLVLDQRGNLTQAKFYLKKAESILDSGLDSRPESRAE
ncbi:MAG: hypothetical protein SGPRY_006653 [Prymnesium sp.]